ncbi:hypothetical protein YC2023_061674 [Brassica napus]
MKLALPPPPGMIDARVVSKRSLIWDLITVSIETHRLPAFAMASTSMIPANRRDSTGLSLLARSDDRDRSNCSCSARPLAATRI